MRVRRSNPSFAALGREPHDPRFVPHLPLVKPPLGGGALRGARADPLPQCERDGRMIAAHKRLRDDHRRRLSEISPPAWFYPRTIP
jgi:hypothetical protein